MILKHHNSKLYDLNVSAVHIEIMNEMKIEPFRKLQGARLKEGKQIITVC